MARWYVNPFVKETRMNWNPRKRHHRRHHRNAHRRHHRRHRHNPDLGSLTGLVQHPGTLIGEGLATAAGAYYTIALPNMILPGLVGGQDLVGKAIRLLVRGVTGAALYAGSRRFMPSFSSGVLNGAMLGAGAGFVLDLMGMSLIVGRGDTAESSLLPAGLAAPAVSGYGAYTQAQRGYGHTRALGAYTQAQRGLGAWNRAGQYQAAGAFGPSAGGFSGNFYRNTFYQGG